MISTGQATLKSETAAVPMAKSDGPLFEYACHEGNYSLAHILANYRAAEAREESR